MNTDNVMKKLNKPVKRDWARYNNGLVSRGNIALFVSKDLAKDWLVQYDEGAKRQRGGQPKYTEIAITSILSLRFVFKLPLRSIEGFAKSMVSLMGVDLEVPDYTTLSTKINTMNIMLPAVYKDNCGHVMSLDSTGLKIHGQGEWNRKKHSQRDRREWVKMHLSVDNESMKILAVEATADDVHDCEVFDQLVDAAPDKIKKVLGDGAYDTLGAYKKSLDKGIELVALPRKNAIVDNDARDPHVIKRNEQVSYYKEEGIHAWANKTGYWDRNRAETTMSRFVTTFSATLASRKVKSQKNEIILKCAILNTFADVIMPSWKNAA